MIHLFVVKNIYKKAVILIYGLFIFDKNKIFKKNG